MRIRMQVVYMVLTLIIRKLKSNGLESKYSKKGKNRIEALSQEKFTISGVDPVELPDITQLKNIRNYIFRIDMDTPQLRDAVQKQLDELARLYPDYKFNATYGGK